MSSFHLFASCGEGVGEGGGGDGRGDGDGDGGEGGVGGGKWPMGQGTRERHIYMRHRLDFRLPSQSQPYPLFFHHR